MLHFSQSGAKRVARPYWRQWYRHEAVSVTEMN
jgi:hypothetical protein